MQTTEWLSNNTGFDKISFFQNYQNQEQSAEEEEIQEVEGEKRRRSTRRLIKLEFFYFNLSNL